MRASGGLVLRCFLLGAATGSRGSLGIAAPLLAGGRQSRARRVLPALGVAGELVIDKLPTTPSRLLPPGPQLRVANAVVGSTVLARRAGASPPLAALAGAAGAVAGTWTGAGWRRWVDARTADWKGAVVEDAVALTLACLAVRGSGAAPSAPN